jgi:tRNA (cmo5U34)-methyltransferase
MTETPKSVHAFGTEHARRYDDRDGELLMGDRQRQRRFLADLLRCLPQEPPMFVELACGTGYFTEVFFEIFPQIRGVAVDGSEAMLQHARTRFAKDGRNLALRCELLQRMDWSVVGPTSLVFSAFAIHHLSHDEKRALFGAIFEYLEPSGFFILFDAFRPDDRKADEIVERLSCLDIERRVRDAHGTAPHLEHIIARDRESKEAEGDREASIESHLHWLREIGFEGVAPVFLEARMGGIVASKPES